MQGKPRGREEGKNIPQGRSKRRLLLTALLITIAVGILAMGALVVVVSASPEKGAQGADWLRNLIGNKPVAELEALVFTMQDKLHQLAYRVEGSTPAAPWEISTPQALGAPVQIIQSTPTTAPVAGIPGGGDAQPTATPTVNVTNGAGNPTPTPNSTIQAPRVPVNLPPLGQIANEGVWMPYIQDANGVTVAYRTFLEPDPGRPYVTVGIVAFDLTRVKLHYVLGITEPTSDISVPRTGQIPKQDQLSGFLLAAFNGGFKTVHGHFGVYDNGQVLVPPIDGMATLAIYNDGSVRIGEWGKDMSLSPDMLVYRQNCPLMVQDGSINPLVYNNSVNDWGGTISGNIVTFRSGVGISQDGNTLYYFAGNTLVMPALAKAMLDAGVFQGMQLDINNYYVHFTHFELQDGQLKAVPLLPKEMVDNIDRYLVGFGHDFFYLTGK